MIEDVEELEPKLQVLFSEGSEELPDAYIGVDVMRSQKGVHAGGSKGPCAVCSEGSLGDPLHDTWRCVLYIRTYTCDGIWTIQADSS